MKIRQLAFAGCSIFALGIGAAYAGPCNMAGKADAGAGPTVGSTSNQTQTTVGSTANQHPPTSTMDRAAGNAAMSSEDAQKQMQGQPTAAQQASGATGTGAAGQGC